EMVGRMRNARRAGAAPVLLIAAVVVVAALGRLDKGEGYSGLAHLVPVDLALPFGDVDAVDGILVGMVLAEINRLVVAVTAVAGRRKLLDVGPDRCARLPGVADRLETVLKTGRAAA